MSIGAMSDFLGHQHRLFGGAADADAEHSGRAPARAHRRHGLQHPVDDRVGGVEHGELRFRSPSRRPWPRRRSSTLSPGTTSHVDHRRRVVASCCGGRRPGRSSTDARSLLSGIEVGAAHALVDHVGDAHRRFPAHVHADAHEHDDDARVLADRAMALGAHARVGEDLRDRVLGRGRLLALVGARQRADVVGRVVVGDELQRVGDALDQVLLRDRGHVASRQDCGRTSRGRCHAAKRKVLASGAANFACHAQECRHRRRYSAPLPFGRLPIVAGVIPTDAITTEERAMSQHPDR